MGAIATYLIGLMLLGLTLSIQDDLSVILKVASALMIVVFLVPLTLHQLEPNNLAERILLGMIGIFVPLTGLLIVPGLFAQIQITGIVGELIARIDLMLYGITMFSIVMFGYRLILVIRSK